MDKESLILLQELDCNCNDCIFMKRDFATYDKWLKFHEKLQIDEFERNKRKMLDAAQRHKEEGERNPLKAKESMKVYEQLVKEANTMKYMFDKSAAKIQYGDCTKFNKAVSFLPGCYQHDTQECFSHRRRADVQ